MLVLLPELEAVEPVPGVIGGLEGAVRDGEGMLQGLGRVMSLPLASVIQRPFASGLYCVFFVEPSDVTMSPEYLARPSPTLREPHLSRGRL